MSVQLGRQGLQGHLVLLDLWVHLARLDYQDQQEQTGILDRKVNQDLQDFLDWMVHQDSRVNQGFRDPPDNLDCLVTEVALVMLGNQVIEGLLDQMDLLETEVPQVLLVPWALLDFLALLDYQVIQVHKAQLDHLAHQVFRDHLGQVALLVTWANLVILGPVVHQVIKVSLVLLEIRDILEFQVLLVQLE